jgi:isopentenyl phosphate kinase
MNILKLGGSVLTDKDKPKVADRAAIRRLSKEIALSGVVDLVLVHGGGSFGHPLAERYNIAEGFKEQPQVLGFSETHRAMVELNNMVVDALISRGIPTFPLPPASFIITSNGRIETLDLQVLRGLLKRGFIPVLYGNTVIDVRTGFSILSGDQLSARLALELKASRLVFGVDVDGVYTSNPKLNPDARLLEYLSLGEAENMAGIGRATTTDVTGGMLGKIREALPVVEAGIPVLILNAKKPHNIFKALKGERVIGTVLRR